jgi:hypothetical protein
VNYKSMNLVFSGGWKLVTEHSILLRIHSQSDWYSMLVCYENTAEYSCPELSCPVTLR